jgi:tRNA(Ile)-lysidine synthase
MDMQGKVLAFVRRESLLAAGETVVVGVSGGPDSLCLLHVLGALRNELGIRLHAAHLNHLIRGADADADAQFVADRAAEWGIPCTVEARDVPAFAREHSLAIEEAARRVRYAFLVEVARRVGATRIAVGHNADDQSETVLMHWLRGAGLAGLRGMLPATHMADLRLIGRPEQMTGLWLVRPLLEVPRPAIEAYNHGQGLFPRFDRSNLDTTLYRNKLRHELLPYLEREFKPRLGEILRRSARVIRDDYGLLRVLVDEAWAEVVREASGEAVVLDRARWRALHPSLQRATLRDTVQHLRRNLRDVNFVHVENAVQVAREGDAGAQATLPQRVVLTVGYRTLTVADAHFVPRPDFPSLAGPSRGDAAAGARARVPLAVPGVTPLPGRGQVEVRIVSRPDLPAGWAQNVDPWRAYLDADVLGPRLTLRSRQAGDRFCPLGLGGRHKKVSDLLINERVPAWWRDRVPLLVDEDDRVVWVCGYRVDERARVRESTKRVAVVHLWVED